MGEIPREEKIEVEPYQIDNLVRSIINTRDQELTPDQQQLFREIVDSGQISQLSAEEMKDMANFNTFSKEKRTGQQDKLNVYHFPLPGEKPEDKDYDALVAHGYKIILDREKVNNIVKKEKGRDAQEGYAFYRQKMGAENPYSTSERLEQSDQKNQEIAAQMAELLKKNIAEK